MNYNAALKLFVLVIAQTLLLPALSQANEPDFQDLSAAYYKDHPGKGKYGPLWSPIPIQKYWNPKDFYQPPSSVQGEKTAEQCVECHQSLTPGAFHAWKNSIHANLDNIRNLSSEDARFYKKQKLEDIEKNLRQRGLLRESENLAQVGCIDCHSGVGAKSVDHAKKLIMPDRAACGTCHVEQFTEAESEKAQTWPQGQWPKGHPSHSMDWKANVETAIWAGMPEREIAQGCDMCHYQQNKCDGCHTRHTFSAAEARQPEACATCHNGVDHNEFENFMLSKHGTVYQTQGKAKWNFEAPLKDALTKGGYTAPTCQYCHFEFEGEFSHNLVRKVRWGFNPTPAIADNLQHPWFSERKEAWLKTCADCHSPGFAEAYLTAADKGTIAGLKVEQEARHVIENLYKDGLLTGQKINRPVPPAPEKDAPGGFFQLFWARGNNPSAVERVHADMWEHDLVKLYKGLVHANPGGFTYTEGWSELMKDYAFIMNENTVLREEHARNLPKPAKNGFVEFLTSGYLLGLVLIGAGVAFILTRNKRS
ncbi:multiheme c-type cytochrome [Candidatus Methylospira mobilis]|uniref:multiheme c-type cytochrome n=1 Tax=Candidatus Methylospira mobilis TaxID=1808979 RepID=UPI0028E2956A|nr:multiheme c-type cytochrome [Candidatus Methylospira mobilis]WNV05707.1 multiheme c-type cytochrome [Candidatus Methylospira mobilis]